MNIEEMEAMPLNELKYVAGNYSIQRVPHGWIYIHCVEGVNLSATFVPEMLPIQEYVLPRG